jgi:hypothetical protein
MTGTQVMKPHGNTRFDVSHTDSEFGVFLVRKLTGAQPSFAIAVEAENADRGETAMTEFADGASGETAVRFLAPGGWMAFSTEVPAAGLYSVWIRVRQETGAPASFQVLGAGEVSEVSIGSDDSPTPRWRWIHLSERTGGLISERFLRLDRGPALIALSVSDENLRFDRFIVTSDLSFSPDQQL